MTKRIIYISLVAAIALAVLALGAGSASAHHGATYHYLLGVEPVEGPDIAMAPNGDTIEITGEGDFTTHPKSATGSGDFVHRDAAGNILGEGTWTATELISYHSYGECGIPGIPNACGGLALFRVHLTAASGFETDGVLRVDCLIGDRVPPGADEGIRLVLPGINFNREVHGETVFLQQP